MSRSTMTYYSQLFTLKNTRGLMGKTLSHPHLKMVYTKNWKLSRWKWVERLLLALDRIYQWWAVGHAIQWWTLSGSSANIFCYKSTMMNKRSLVWKLTTLTFQQLTVNCKSNLLAIPNSRQTSWKKLLPNLYASYWIQLGAKLIYLIILSQNTLTVKTI